MAGLAGSAGAAPIDIANCAGFEAFPFEQMQDAIRQEKPEETIDRIFEEALGKPIAEVTNDDLSQLRDSVRLCSREGQSDYYAGSPGYSYRATAYGIIRLYQSDLDEAAAAARSRDRN